jgi:hypothetical protein
MIEQRFGKDFLIKEVQAPRPEPDEVDQENGSDDHRESDDRSKEFQNILQHGALVVG